MGENAIQARIFDFQQGQRAQCVKLLDLKEREEESDLTGRFVVVGQREFDDVLRIDDLTETIEIRFDARL